MYNRIVPTTVPRTASKQFDFLKSLYPVYLALFNYSLTINSGLFPFSSSGK
jgi:hypothetical protein